MSDATAVSETPAQPGGSLRRALKLHRSASAALRAAAAAIPADRWHEPIAAGKWSPAVIVEHLLSTYDVVLAELRGGPGMKIRTRWWQRVLLQAFVVPRILISGRFPERAPAPREVRPPDSGREREEALALFERRAGEFERLALAAGPRQRVTHAYFGAGSVSRGVAIVARHIQHHSAQIRDAAGS